MCFFTTARITQFYCALFNALGVPVLEMHSRKSQAQRTRAADQFRAATRCVMFSSDVSARGVDYPDVSLVVQVSALEGPHGSLLQLDHECRSLCLLVCSQHHRLPRCLPHRPDQHPPGPAWPLAAHRNMMMSA